MKTAVEWEKQYGHAINPVVIAAIQQDAADEVSAKYEARIALLNDAIDRLNNEIEGLYQDMKGEDV